MYMGMVLTKILGANTRNLHDIDKTADKCVVMLRPSRAPLPSLIRSAVRLGRSLLLERTRLCKGVAPHQVDLLLSRRTRMANDTKRMRHRVRSVTPRS